MAFNASSISVRALDLGTVLGILLGLALVTLGILAGGGLTAFFDLPSFLIVVGGTLGATLVTFPLADLSSALAVARRAFSADTTSAALRMRRLLELNVRTRAQGVLAIQDEALRERDPFFRKGLELLVDTIPPEDLKRILEFELASLTDRHVRGAQIFQTMGAVAPAMGLIGTLIGLVQMLERLDTPAIIGPAMAIALVTTFYGAVLAHLVFLPIAGKLRYRSEEESLSKEMTLEGILCIARGFNPRITEECLSSFLPPEKRRAHARW